MLTPLTHDQFEALRQFADLEIPIERLRCRLKGAIDMDFDSDNRTVTERFEIPRPGVRIELKHIDHALDKKRRGQITEKELSDWAAALVMIHAYDWEGKNEAKISDWLNDLSYLSSEIE